LWAGPCQDPPTGDCFSRQDNWPAARWFCDLPPPCAPGRRFAMRRYRRRWPHRRSLWRTLSARKGAARLIAARPVNWLGDRGVR
jgi:hypothetical protein